MSIYRHEDSPFRLSSFSLSDQERSQFAKQLNEGTLSYSADTLVRHMLPNHHAYFSSPDDKLLKDACESVAFKVIFHNTTLPYDFLTEDERAKANAVYARSQYNSKLLQKLLAVFTTLLHVKRNQIPNGIFTLSVLETYEKLNEDKLIRSFGKLKTVIDKITGGVPPQLYAKAESFPFVHEDTLEEKLNEHFFRTVGYDFNKAVEKINDHPSFPYSADNQDTVRLLQNALLNNADYWASHSHFNVIAFLNLIAEEDDRRRAEKLLDHIIQTLSKMPYMAPVFKNNLPLYVSDYDKMLQALEDQTHRFTLNRLSAYCDISKLNTQPLCYPMSTVDTSLLTIGKTVWEGFIIKYNYPEHSSEVMAYLNNEVKDFVAGKKKKDDSNVYNLSGVAVILDFASFRFHPDASERRLFKLYDPNCFSYENIWNRVYLKAYAVTLLSDDENTQFSYLQRIFVDIIKMIEINLGIHTKHQLDVTARNKQYEALKNKLSAYGISTDDTHQNDYVIALLDRDTAMVHEVERFPVLEQLGDAIYGYAVAERLFYNPNTERIAKCFEDYTRAEAQVHIAKTQGFDTLFLQIGLPAKYVEYDALSFNYDTAREEQLQCLNQEKYLADMMEMIIGAIYLDQGLDKALAFSKALLKKAFPEAFAEEIHPTEEYKNDRGIDRDYWARILPAPCSIMQDPQSTMWRALDKLLLTVSLGTEDQDCRDFITRSFGNAAIYGDHVSLATLSWTFYDYLTKGLPFVLDKTKDIIRSYYQKNYQNQ